MVTPSAASLLTQRPKYKGVWIDSTAPSRQAHTVTWPNGATETIPLGGAVTDFKQTDGPEEVKIFRRGSNEHARMLDLLAEREQMLEDVRAEIEEEVDTRVAVRMGEVERGLGFDREARPPASKAPLPLSTEFPPCGKPEAPTHHDCIYCDDPDTGHPPRHFDRAPQLTGHKRSETHKARKAEALEGEARERRQV